MIWMKSCPRCHGDLYEGSDLWGEYIACAQCGHYLSEAEEVVLRYVSRAAQAGTRKKEAREEPLHAAAAD